MLAVNLSSVLFACRAAVPHLGAGSAIVNVSSLAGKRGSANNAAYCAAKFGVNGLTQAFAKELGPRGIRVNAVCPVYVQTDGVRDALADPHGPARGRIFDAYLTEFARTPGGARPPSARGRTGRGLRDAGVPRRPARSPASVSTWTAACCRSRTGNGLAGIDSSRAAQLRRIRPGLRPRRRWTAPARRLLARAGWARSAGAALSAPAC